MTRKQMYKKYILENNKVIRKIKYNSFLTYMSLNKGDINKIVKILSNPKKFGTKSGYRKGPIDNIKADYKRGVNVIELSVKYDLSERTIYRYIRDYENI